MRSFPQQNEASTFATPLQDGRMLNDNDKWLSPKSFQVIWFNWYEIPEKCNKREQILEGWVKKTDRMCEILETDELCLEG